MAAGSGKKDKRVKSVDARGKARGQQRRAGAGSAATFERFRFWPITAPQAPRDPHDAP